MSYALEVHVAYFCQSHEVSFAEIGLLEHRHKLIKLQLYVVRIQTLISDFSNGVSGCMMMPLHHGAMCWSVIKDCEISWLYSLMVLWMSQ